MSIAILMLTLMTGVNGVRSGWNRFEHAQQTNAPISQSAGRNGSQIKITIATGGMPYQPAKDTYHVGEPIPLVITMTNTGSEPVYVCESGSIYQDRPRLLRDGRPVPYTSFRQSMVNTAEKDQTCQVENLPQQVLLRPNDPVVVDWFNLVQGTSSLYDDGWYELLPAGKYTLTDQRRLNCCDGPVIVTNTIDFVVVP